MPITFYHITKHPLKSIVCFIRILLCNHMIVQCLSNHGEIISGSSDHQIIRPSFFIYDNETALGFLSPKVGCPETLRLQFECFGDDFVINLVKNSNLISKKYSQIIKHGEDTQRFPLDGLPDPGIKPSKLREVHYPDQMFVTFNDHIPNDDHCHYQGVANTDPRTISAITIINSHLLNGYFHQQDNYYYLDSYKNLTILTRSTTISKFRHEINFRNDSGSQDSPKILHQDVIRKKRQTSSRFGNSKIIHGPFNSNSSSLYVELLIVHDHNQYIEYNRNSTNIFERTMQIVNIMNAFYRQLNIFISLVGVIIWTEKDLIKLTDDGDLTLNNFLKYRYEELLPRFHHDNAQLITSTSFNGSVVGKALKGPICTHDHSGGVNTDHSHVPAIVAVTLAHELGHNLGMEHDEDEKCKCPDEKCIMSSSSSAVHPKHWSTCSIEYLEESKQHGLLDCLINEPDQVFGPICGNGFVEEGEDCDIGEPMPSYGTSRSRGKNNGSQRCSRGLCPNSADQTGLNPCCDRNTCKFIGNATCAQGDCCDLSKCSVYNSSDVRVCRKRKDVCDFEEICDGVSEYCPPDVYYHDGIECGPTFSLDSPSPRVGSLEYNRSRAYCYNGKCASHESQCRLLWGPTGYSSKDICYEQNIHGNTSGNCGYDRKDRSYHSCDTDDTPCGMLHCVHDQPAATNDIHKTGKLGYGFDSATTLTVSSFTLSNQDKIYCYGAIIDAGPDIRDPGLVPNGAACGDDRMCLEQKCVPIYEIIYKNWCPSDCNGNGICDNMGVCHCDDGTIGTSCYQFFGSNFHLSFFLYVIMFFGPIIALVVLAVNHYRTKIKIWWYLHNRMVILKSKARDANHHPRRLAYDVNGHKVVISEPIPLSQQDNRPFYQPDMDPWAETTSDSFASGKSPGYRLDPITKQSEQLHQIVTPPIQSTIASFNDNQHDLRPIRSAPPPPPPPHPNPLAPIPPQRTTSKR